MQRAVCYYVSRLSASSADMALCILGLLARGHSAGYSGGPPPAGGWIIIGGRTPEEEMLRAVLVVACIASASAFGLAPATPALRSVGKASLPLSTRPSVRARALGGATKLSALGNLFGLGEPRCFMCIARIDTAALWHAGFNFCQRRADPFSTGAELLDRG